LQAIRDQFLKWCCRVQDGKPSRYDLYCQMLKNLPDSDAFWSEVNRMADRLEIQRRKMLHYLLMDAVHYLALGDSHEPVAAFFPSSSAYNPNLDRAEAGASFWEFFQRQRQEIWSLVQTRDVQINKLGRLALFAPLFLEIARRSSPPLAFVDVGCSVGLGLLWPYYDHNYPGHGTITCGRTGFGELDCAIEGTPSIPLTGSLPTTNFLCGIELSPLSTTCENDVRWLLALTAPDDKTGRERLQQGLAAVAKVKPRIEQGDMLKVLPQLEREWKDNATLVVYHSMTMHHLQDSEREIFQKILMQLANRRRVFEIGVEWTKRVPPDHEGPLPVEIIFCEWRANDFLLETIGETDPSADGRWIKFK
jgi:hypothetical protein